MTRPVLFVLAGVNGAGKSSIGGHLIRRQGLDWFNPDTFARELKALTGCTQQQANALAWQEGVRRLDQALAAGEHHALETTLGGNTLPQRILAATRTHDVLIWFCGLTSPALHRERVLARVAVGGHDIPEDKIRARFDSARANLIGLLPHVQRVNLFDNSHTVPPGTPIPDPLPVARIEQGRLVWPDTPAQMERTPEWARPILGACLG